MALLPDALAQTSDGDVSTFDGLRDGALRRRSCSVLGVAVGGPAVPPAPLPPPAGTVVHVATVAQLQNAVAAIASNTTILIGPGTYNLRTLYINGSFTNVGIRGRPETATTSCWSGKG